MCNSNFSPTLNFACGGIVEPKKTTYSIDYFLNFFNSIPEDKWMIGDWHNQEKTKFCALGHLGGSGFKGHTQQGVDLADLMGSSVAEINDGKNIHYQQLHPKDRIMAALNDVKMFGKAKFTPKEKATQWEITPVVKMDHYSDYYLKAMFDFTVDYSKITFEDMPKIEVREVIKEVTVEKVVEKIVYVTVDQEVRQLQAEQLIEN